jgi:hypothetical protein
MKTWIHCLVLTVSSAMTGIGNAHSIADTASVYLVADKGNYVGGTIPTGEMTLHHGDGATFRALGRQYDGVVYVYTEHWDFRFQAPEPGPGLPGNQLEVGLYGNATRWPFNAWDVPGLSVSGNHRGANLSSGWFNVLDIAYDSFGSMTRLAVDFRQFENLTQTGPSLFGSLRYNSPVPITSAVPEPSTVAMLLAGVAIVAMRRRKAASPR